MLTNTVQVISGDIIFLGNYSKLDDQFIARKINILGISGNSRPLRKVVLHIFAVKTNNRINTILDECHGVLVRWKSTTHAHLIKTLSSQLL